VALVAVGDGAAGSAGFLLDDDPDRFAVELCGGGDELFDGAGCFADADEVCEVEVSGVVVEVEAFLFEVCLRSPALGGVENLRVAGRSLCCWRAGGESDQL
jgi:hypothetical protein